MLGIYGPRFAGVESLTLATVALILGMRNARGEQLADRHDDAAIGLAHEAETAKIAEG
jgi:hypothetical protein